MTGKQTVPSEATPSPEDGVPSLRETLETAGRRDLERLRLEKSRGLFGALTGYPGVEQSKVRSSGAERVVARQVTLMQPDGTVNTLRVVEATPVNVYNPHDKVALYVGAQPPVEEGADFAQGIDPDLWIDTHKYKISSQDSYSLRDLQGAIAETLLMDDLLQQVEAGKVPNVE